MNIPIIGEKKPDPIVTNLKALKKISGELTTWHEVRELDLIERLKAANRTAWTKGIGLAAVQIGVYLRMSWFIDLEAKKEYVLINPKITKATGPVVVPKEGCLSIPDVWTTTIRFNDITVMTQGEKEPVTLEFSGFPAIVVQHEIDHMNGIVNLQRRYIPPQKAGRNDPCPCKSGKKYKKCCLGKLEQPEPKEVKEDALPIENSQTIHERAV